MKFEIKSRWTAATLFTAELDVKFKNSPRYIQTGEAVKQAVLSGAVLSGAVLSSADLRNAVLSSAVLSSADLSGADLRNAVLRGADLRNAVLRDADLRDADLSGAVLSSADLRGADLSGAALSSADLRDADLRGAGSGVPIIPDIHKRVYEAASADGALDMSLWHASCGTTHCRAGWVVTLAGDAGRAMEWCIGTPAAAALIYMVSDPKLERIPNFYASNDAALADMKRLAEAGG